MASLASSRRLLAKSLQSLDAYLADGNPGFRNQLFICNQRVASVRAAFDELEEFGKTHSDGRFQLALDAQRIQVSFTERELARIERELVSSKPN